MYLRYAGLHILRLLCAEWDVKPYSTVLISILTLFTFITNSSVCFSLQLIEKYMHDVDTAVWDLDRMHGRLVESLDNNDKTTVREFLVDQMADNNSLLNRVKPLLEHGQWL